MAAIQVELDDELLKAANQAAQRKKLSRSALIREALSAHLVRLHKLDLEDQDRRGYATKPQTSREIRRWEGIASWPAE
jgi:metal-responsive CopG/Arc/MetJ family transcriptional regulator